MQQQAPNPIVEKNLITALISDEQRRGSIFEWDRIIERGVRFSVARHAMPQKVREQYEYREYRRVELDKKRVMQAGGLKFDIEAFRARMLGKKGPKRYRNDAELFDDIRQSTAQRLSGGYTQSLRECVERQQQETYSTLMAMESMANFNPNDPLPEPEPPAPAQQPHAVEPDVNFGLAPGDPGYEYPF